MSQYPFDLGPYTRTVTTDSAAAQVWFNRGLNWMYAYNYEEAQACFQAALKEDPGCAMAHWGTAYAIGPNYNKPWQLFDQQDIQQTLENATAAIASAKRCYGSATSVEKGLIDALDKRYQSSKPVEDLYMWSTAYADAMRELHKKHPKDWDVAGLFVESMMNRTPWQMWDPREGTPIDGADTMECKAVLETAIAAVESEGEDRHPGLLHLYVHLMEMSPTPEAALKAADELRNLIPDAGHLKHMSTHIDVLCGNYKDVVAGNSAAIDADMKFIEHAGVMNFYSLYRLHNFHFKLYGAMFLGQFEQAMSAVSKMRETIPEDLVRLESPPMVNWLEGYLAMETHALVRFGRWQALVDAPLPEDQDFYCMTSATNYYGKGIAHAALGNHKAALKAQEDFEKAFDTIGDYRYVHVVSCRQILGVAREMLAGEIAYHHGDYDTAFAHLRQAVENEDSLPYDEPWGWMMPSRHALGALLLEQGHAEEAMAAYEADLGLDDSILRSNQHPDNVWALVGLDKCYRKLGKLSEAQMIKPRLAFALSRADKEIQRSCFCSMRDVA